ncbi:HEAT repeat domain-containing protein [Tautonia marina]|uniref:HEAT repeat domain-containing protein n=1 Tax=Tautonia marina TaxID=2653855 RepID=UPI001260648E|nr:HEAT repeat domain-containing protein [Tautonia marina]
MRLTLRTLLAWLDDTLPPEEVREIGTQVSSTPFAQTLIERIRKVTRRRRLTIPPTSGPEAVDPNTVAAYLDNELEAEKVAEYEKLCLESDVHLAEAASCHQILSLIKNKAKVPSESRYRMYRLFKGPEAVRTNYRVAVPPAAGMVPDAVSGAPEAPWAKTAPVPRSWFEQVVPWLVAVLLIVVLGAVGYLNLRYAGVQIQEADSLAAAQFDPDAAKEPDEEVADEEGDARPAPPPLSEPARVEETDQPEPEPEPTPEQPAEPAEPEAPLAAGDVAVVEQTDGIVLRANPTWERLSADDSLAPGDRVVNLAPFRTTLSMGSVRITLIAQSELRVEPPALADTPRFALIDGSVVLRSPNAEEPIAVGFEGRTLSLQLPPGRPVGLSWMGLKVPGQPAGRPLLTILCPAGALGVTFDDGDPQEFEGPTLVSVDPEDGILGAEPAVMPQWVVDPEPQPADIQAGEAFVELFEQSTGSITFTLLEGIEDPDPTVRSLSVAALGAMAGSDPEALEQVMPLLNRPGDPAVRGTAIGIVMRRMARGTEPAEDVRGLLERFIAPPEATEAFDRLLLGVPEDQIEEKEVYAELVADLSSPNAGVRQLALDTLMMLTGRETLGYDPDSPEGPGLKAWQDLLKENRLTPAR